MITFHFRRAVRAATLEKWSAFFFTKDEWRCRCCPYSLGNLWMASTDSYIVIPIHNVKGELVAYAGRWPGEPPDKDTPKYKIPASFKKSQEMFNLDRAIKEPADKPLAIVKGFFDVIKLHQLGHRRVVGLMDDIMSPAQEELIRRHAKSNDHIVIMLAGHGDIAARLAKHCFVRTHTFDKTDAEPEHLTAEEVRNLLPL